MPTPAPKQTGRASAPWSWDRLRHLRARLLEERGQALVEFAIVVTILLAVVIGILYFGQYLNYTIDQTHLANIAARYAAVNEDPGCPNNDPTQTNCPTLAQYVQSQADGKLQSGGGPVSAAQVTLCLPDGGTGAVGQPVEAKVTSHYNAIPFIHVASFSVTETATMMLEDAPASQLFTGTSC